MKVEGSGGGHRGRERFRVGEDRENVKVGGRRKGNERRKVTATSNSWLTFDKMRFNSTIICKRSTNEMNKKNSLFTLYNKQVYAVLKI